MKKVKKVIILAAGMGTRFYPITKDFPKEMLPIIDKPNLQYLLEEAIKSGIEEAYIVINKEKEMIKSYFSIDDNLKKDLIQKNKEDILKDVEYIINNLKITYIYQDKMLGTGYAINLAKQYIGDESFALMYGDDLILSEIPALKQLIDLHYETNANILGVREVPITSVSRYGIIKYYDENTNKISSIVEKPKAEDAPSRDASTGRFVINSEVFNYIEQLELKNGEYIFAEAIDLLMKKQEFYSCKYSGRYFDIGNKNEYIKSIIYSSINDELYKEDILKFIKEL